MQETIEEIAKRHPVGNVVWLKREELKPNLYNPNQVFPLEMALLKTSILEDGWTQPIVARSDREIVDGFHRWTISADPEVYALTNGNVPVVVLPPVEGDMAHQMMSTIRHNRARGSHYVLKMADIVGVLVDQMQLPEAEIMRRLGMEAEEVKRLHERGNMLKRGSKEGFNNGWVPDA